MSHTGLDSGILTLGPFGGCTILNESDSYRRNTNGIQSPEDSGKGGERMAASTRQLILAPAFLHSTLALALAPQPLTASTAPLALVRASVLSTREGLEEIQ